MPAILESAKREMSELRKRLAPVAYWFRIPMWKMEWHVDYEFEVYSSSSVRSIRLNK